MVLLRSLLNSVVFPLRLKGTRKVPSPTWVMRLFFLRLRDNCYFLRNCSFPTLGSFSWNMQTDIWTKTQEEPYAYFWSSFSFEVFNPTKILLSLPKAWFLFPYLSETAELTQVNLPCVLDMELSPGKQPRITWLHFSQEDGSYAAYFPRFKFSHFLFSFQFSSSSWGGRGVVLILDCLTPSWLRAEVSYFSFLILKCC